MSRVSFIDAAGVGVIVLAARRLGPGAVALVLPHRGLVRIFRICGLDRLLDFYETREQAVRGLPRWAAIGRGETGDHALGGRCSRLTVRWPIADQLL